MSIKKYMVIDLTIMALLLCVLEAACAFAYGLFLNEAYLLTQVMTITLISMMRWGPYGLVHAFLGGIVYCILYNGSPASFVIYAFGNLGIAASLIIFKQFGKERVRLSKFLSVIYCIAGFLGMNIARAVIAVILLSEPAVGVFMRFTTTDALSFVISIVAVLIAAKQNGMFEDQKTYLIRLAEEERIGGK